jgi:hypothetical protein
VKRTPTAAAFLAEPVAVVGKEQEALKMPTDLPTVNDLHHWLALIASALVEASAYDDRAEVAWFSKVNDPSVTFEALADSEKDRLKHLDMMLSNMLQSNIGRAGELGRLVAAKTQRRYRAGNLAAGRQIAHILCMRLRTNDKMAMVYSVADLCNVTWQGDTPEQVTRFRDQREKILDHMSTRLDDDTLRGLLLEQ